MEARAENDSIRRKREEEEKVAKQHQEVRIKILYDFLRLYDFMDFLSVAKLQKC